MPSLFYIIGASGVGKDTLINYARRQLAKESQKILFLHRYITRDAGAGGENHVYLNENEFKIRLENNFFAMSWASHGYKYGIGIEAEHYLEKGFSVVINGSREYLPIAVENFDELVPVLITVDENELAERLHDRGRETSEEIERRLERARSFNEVFHHALKRIDNSDWNDNAGNELTLILKGEL